MRFIWFFLAVVTSACVPTARLRPTSGDTLNTPSPPGPRKSAAALLCSDPSPTRNDPAVRVGEGEQRVEGAYRWAGNEYRYIPAHNEKKRAPYVWQRP